MRETFGLERGGDIGFGTEFDPEFVERASSADQLAVVWTSGGEVATASPMPNVVSGSFGMDVARFPADYVLTSAVNVHRTRDLGVPALSQATQFLTAVGDYSERTRILALDGEKLALNDNELLQWLINAEKQMVLGTDQHPVFETSLDDTACSIRRLPNGQISMTEVPRQYLQNLETRIRSLAGAHRTSPVQIRVETPLRCAARYFLTATKEGKETLRPGNRSDVTAFLIVNRAGYSFGMWSPQTGLFTEYAFLAPDEVSPTRKGVKGVSSAGKPATRGVEEYVKQAFDQLTLQMSPDKLEHLQLSSYAQIVWAAEPNLAETAAPIAAECAAHTGMDVFALSVSADEAVARGLLLGSYSFGDLSVAGADILPPVDLTHDILAMADTEAFERSREEEARMQGRRNRAILTMLSAPVIVAACLLALAASLVGSYFLTALRDSKADARTAELKPALERRKSYEANLKWYQEFVSEVSQLRRQQPIGIGLLYQLNANYPFSIDPAFYVSDLKLTPTGAVEMKGMARNKDAVASFLKALEFAGGPESGTRLFSNLAYEVQEIAPTVAAAQTKLPALTGSTLGSTSTVAPGVVVWSIKGNYLPMAEIAPKPAAANQPATPGQTAPAQTAAAPKPAG